jgi:hypothetical protein
MRNDGMIKSDELEQRQLWSILAYCFGICLKEMSKTTKRKSLRKVGFPVTIQTRYILKKKKKQESSPLFFVMLYGAGFKWGQDSSCNSD